MADTYSTPTAAELDEYQNHLFGQLSGTSEKAIGDFCAKLPSLPKSQYPDALLGMGHLYEAFDLMFAVIAANIQATHDESPYVARYVTMQNVLQPFASEYGIEPDRKLQKTHRELYADFYTSATGEPWPAKYPSESVTPWLACGRRWTRAMLDRLQGTGLSSVERARYNLGYHWAVEALSVNEFNQLIQVWRTLGFDAPYMSAHCEVEEDHASCAIGAVVSFSSTEDPLVVKGACDHEDDLAGFYQECTELISQSQRVLSNDGNGPGALSDHRRTGLHRCLGRHAACARGSIGDRAGRRAWPWSGAPSFGCGAARAGEFRSRRRLRQGSGQTNHR